MGEQWHASKYALAVARKSVIAIGVIGLCIAAGLLAVAQHFGRLDPLLDMLSSADEPEPGPLPALKLVDAFPKLEFRLPLWFGHDGTGSGWLYVCEQDGRIWRFKKEGESKELFLDLSAKIPGIRQRHNEEGLLALAFHPKFKQNRFFYIHYSLLKNESKPRRGVTSRFTALPEGGVADPDSERILFEVEQPWGNHNGCTLIFGKDGYLYSSFGDGGAGGDPLNSGQRMDTRLGKVLRMDVDKPDGNQPWSVPRDNPFVGRAGVKPEIWAWGLRNVWRMAFDAETGLLWGGDVGQVSYEEIDIIEKGGNYGWRKREGFHPYGGGSKTDEMIDPVIDYDRSQGISVTGGVVYRGKAIEALKGAYLYADYGSGRLWGLSYDVKEKRLTNHQLLLHARNSSISSFGEDPEGEVYVCGHLRKKIWRLEVDK